MTVTWTTPGFPVSEDTYASLTDGVDEVVANHPNTLASAIGKINDKIGINGDTDNVSIDYLRGVAAYRVPELQWSSTSTINLTTVSGSPASATIPLNDRKIYQMDGGSLQFSFSLGAAENGLDTGTEAVSTWYYLYAVPKAADTTKYVLRASINVPETGPSGYTAYRYLGAFYNNSAGNIVGFKQCGNRFTYIARQIIENTPASDVAAVSVSIAAVVPATAFSANLFLHLQGAASSWGYCYLWYDGQQGSEATRFSEAWYSAGWEHDYVEIEMPVSSGRNVYRKRTYGAATLNIYEFGCFGWSDWYL